ncbi:MAG: hypothetical protein ACAH59_11915, partial [Pseudobdellovibrionaceae bacterium]
MNEDDLFPDRMLLKSTRTLATIIVCAMPLAVIRWLNLGVEVLWPQYLALTIACLTLILVIRRPSLSTRHLLLLFLAIHTSIQFASSMVSHSILRQDLQVELFTGYKILPLVIALIAPTPAWLGHVLIATSLFLPPLQILLI